jgi:hypothetical protein
MTSLTLSASMGARSGARLQPPTAGLYLRLFADTSYFALYGGKITTWQGTGSSGKAASQGTGVLQPVPGTGINGRTTVTTNNTWLSVASVALGAFDIYMVLKTSTANRYPIEHSSNSVSSNGHFMYTGNVPGVFINRGAANKSSINPTSASWLHDGAACLIQHGHDGTHAGHILKRNGTAVAAGVPSYTQNPGTSIVTDTMYLGCHALGSIYTGEIGEILIYDSAPDATRAAQVLAYCRQYWGTP